jgi:hypothetical protein
LVPANIRILGPAGVRSSHRTKEVSGMLTAEMAKYRIQDRIREAEHDRAHGSARRDRDAGRTGVVREVGSGLFAAVIGRRRKATPTSAAIGVAR